MLKVDNQIGFSLSNHSGLFDILIEKNNFKIPQPITKTTLYNLTYFSTFTVLQFFEFQSRRYSNIFS